MDERVHMARFLGGNVVLDVEALHLAREARGEGRCVELRDGGDAGLARDQIGPAVGDGIADGRDDAKTGNDDATTAHR